MNGTWSPLMSRHGTAGAGSSATASFLAPLAGAAAIPMVAYPGSPRQGAAKGWRHTNFTGELRLTFAAALVFRAWLLVAPGRGRPDGGRAPVKLSIAIEQFRHHSFAATQAATDDAACRLSLG